MGNCNAATPLPVVHPSPSSTKPIGDLASGKNHLLLSTQSVLQTYWLARDSTIHFFFLMPIIINTFFAICRVSMPTFGRPHLPVWEFYEKVNMADGKVKAQCNNCSLCLQLHAERMEVHIAQVFCVIQLLPLDISANVVTQSCIEATNETKYKAENLVTTGLGRKRGSRAKNLVGCWDPCRKPLRTRFTAETSACQGNLRRSFWDSLDISSWRF